MNMETRWPLLLLFLFTVSSLTSCEDCMKTSHVITSFKDLVSTSGGKELLTHAQNYSTLLLEDSGILVGARDQVIKIDKQNFTVIKVLNWTSSSLYIDACLQMNTPKEECSNFIQVLQPFQGRLLVCGTNSYQPMCTWKNLTDLSSAVGSDNNGNFFYDRVDGIGLVPYSPKIYSTGIISELGRYYAGTMLDGGARFPTIFSSDFKKRPRILETVRRDRNWLSDTQFVKTFNIGKYIYFFFREEAIENEYSKTRVSTVARICKGDYGGSMFLLSKNFVTFNKARLSCTTRGLYPTRFTEIQDVFWDERSTLFYAVFASEPNGGNISAVCAYDLGEIERVFKGDYKYYNTRSERWETHQNQHHFNNCTVKPSSLSNYDDNTKKKMVPKDMMATRIMTIKAYQDSKKYQLMQERVAPQTLTAQYIKQGFRFKNIALDYVNNKQVMYIGTAKASILKVFEPVRGNGTCILEEILLFNDEDKGKINQIKLDSKNGFLYATTSTKFIRIQLARCKRHQDKTSCLEAKDPYCGWSQSQGCTSWKNSGPNWEQKLDGCPALKAVWSSWSSWQVCPQQDGNVCQCRKRRCLNTRSESDCQGQSIDAKQCTVNKQQYWTSESHWLREGVINGGWNAWSSWSPCSVSAGSGVRVSRRDCTNPAPKNGGQSCFGESTKYMDCIVNLPLKSKQKHVWTELTGVLGKKNAAMRQMYTCSVQGHDLVNMTLSITKTELVDCRQDRTRCKIPPTNPPGLWSAWSKWSSCVVVGMQYRTRACDDDDKPCIGNIRDDRRCYPQPPTTTTSTSTGRSTTTTTTAPTSTRQIIPTEPDTSWSTWSSCLCDLPFKVVPESDNPDSVGIQYRARRCKELHPNDGRCPKDRVEYKTCECEKEDTFVYNKLDGSNPPTKKTGYRIGDVIGAAIVTGVLVLVICAVMAYILVRRRQNFEVSKVYEKSMREDPDDSRYQGTNGTEYPSETSKDRNSSAKLQPVVREPKSKKITNFFRKHQEPEAV